MPEQLLARARLAFPALTAVQAEALVSDTPTTALLAPHEAAADRQRGSNAVVELPVAASATVIPLSSFLTSDPSAEGPFPGEARNLVRRAGRSDGAAIRLSSAVSVSARHRFRDEAPACSDHAHRQHAGGCDVSGSCCVYEDASQQADDDRSVAAEPQPGQGQHACTPFECSAADDTDPWRPFRLPDAELHARGAIMDIVTVRASACQPQLP